MLTNAVWGLAHQKYSIVPDEIVVFITKRGKELLSQKLFDEGVWNAMRSDLKREKQAPAEGRAQAEALGAQPQRAGCL